MFDLAALRAPLADLHASYKQPADLLWRRYLALKEAQLKERIIDADNRGEVAAQVYLLRELLRETTPPPNKAP